MDRLIRELCCGSGKVNPEFNDCLRKGKLKKFSQGKSLVKKELDTSERDLAEVMEEIVIKIL